MLLLEGFVRSTVAFRTFLGVNVRSAEEIQGTGITYRRKSLRRTSIWKHCLCLVVQVGRTPNHYRRTSPGPRYLH
jgi:hypothetical protein